MRDLSKQGSALIKSFPSSKAARAKPEQMKPPELQPGVPPQQPEQPQQGPQLGPQPAPKPQEARP